MQVFARVTKMPILTYNRANRFVVKVYKVNHGYCTFFAKTKVLLPQALVTLAVLGFLAPIDL